MPALRVAAVSSAATAGASLATWAIAPQHTASVAAAAACFCVVAELRRSRSAVNRRMNELELEVAQMEPLLELTTLLPTRHPLPPMRGYAIAPDFALLLANLVLDERPELVVETGSGVSTLIVAYALEKLGRGRVVALDHDESYAERTRAEIALHGLQAYAEVRHAPLQPLTVEGEEYVWHALDALEGLEGIDLLVDDGPPRYLGKMLRYASLPVFAPRMSPRATFVLDVIGDEEQAILARWQERFPDMQQERLETKKGNVLLRRVPRTSMRITSLAPPPPVPPTST